MDKITKKERSRLMSRIKSKDTKPEMVVRKILTSLGVKYRLHSNKLDGKPDISINKFKTLIFVNGCFWHQHKDCPISNEPKSNTKYWKPKLEKNVKKQQEAISVLTKQHYKVLVFWECETKRPESLTTKIKEQLFYEK